ncbi:hypothetical protein [Algoriphagus resistens]|uniref:hypothetical protein n=1 Tax=Algoriphagus resistens TaxID=1750590 RepID=UPI00071696ED|nr:hypothetical protein [Algoriphagus resistens]
MSENIIIAYTGELRTIDIQAKGTIPAFRIEGVFSKKKHFKEFAEHFHFAYEHTLLLSMKLPLNPKYGDKEKGLKAYQINVKQNFQVVEVEKIKKPAEDDPRFHGNHVRIIYEDSGDYIVFCWARDEFDACKRAITEAREMTVKFEVNDEILGNTTIHMPTDPEITFKVPMFFEIPDDGEIFKIDFERFITDPDEWEIAQSVLENDVMVVDRIDGDEVWLREGNPA